ncbi:hypothetical protein ABD07_00290 [Nitrosomonas oligotropha]|nr:hypothetical protein [Nitrosomonas oligotropha]
MTAEEIIESLGGTSIVAEILGIKPPSVSEWKTKNEIPDDKLIRLAVSLEIKTSSRINRRMLFPVDWREIWPELSEVDGVCACSCQS